MIEVDAKGLDCPLPLLKAKQALNQIDAGEKVTVYATDPGSQRDFTTFAKLSGHLLLETSDVDGVYSYLLQKADI